MFGAGEMNSELMRTEFVWAEITTSPLLFCAIQFFTTFTCFPHLFLVCNESLQILKTIHVDVKLKMWSMYRRISPFMQFYYFLIFKISAMLYPVLQIMKTEEWWYSRNRWHIMYHAVGEKPECTYAQVTVSMDWNTSACHWSFNPLGVKGIIG